MRTAKKIEERAKKKEKQQIAMGGGGSMSYELRLVRTCTLYIDAVIINGTEIIHYTLNFALDSYRTVPGKD